MFATPQEHGKTPSSLKVSKWSPKTTASKEEIEDLMKENFNLKLRLLHYEEGEGKEGRSEAQLATTSNPLVELVEEAKEIIQKLQEDLSTANQKTERLEGEVRTMERGQAELMEELKDARDKKIQYEFEAESWREKFETTEKRTESLYSNELKDLRDRYQVVLDEKDSYLQESKQLKHKVATLEKEKAELKSTFENKESTLKHQIEQLQNEKHDYSGLSRRTALQLQNEVRSWKDRSEELEGEVRRLRTEASAPLQTVKKQDPEVNRTTAALREENAKLQNFIGELEASLRSAQQRSMDSSPIKSELERWYSLAEEFTGSKKAEVLRKYLSDLLQGDGAATGRVSTREWEDFAERLTGSRSIDAVERYIQSHFDRISRQLEAKQRQKSITGDRLAAQERQLRQATDSLKMKAIIASYENEISELRNELRRVKSRTRLE